MSGTKPAPKPCNLCGPGSPPLNTGEASGSIATISTLGYSFLKTLPTSSFAKLTIYSNIKS